MEIIGAQDGRAAHAEGGHAMSDLAEEVRAAVRGRRHELEAFRASPRCRLDALNATTAVLRLADGASVDDVARDITQPAWRVRLWANRLAAIGMEAVEAGYWPEQVRLNDVETYVAGLLFDSPLTVTGLLAWARGSWIATDMGVDADDTEAWLVWPECGYHVAMKANESRVEHVRNYYVRDVDTPAGVEVRALMCGVVGDETHPDAINRGMELWVFLDEQPGAIVRGRDGRTTISG